MSAALAAQSSRCWAFSHRQPCADIFVVAVAIPVLALVVVVTLGSAFGAF